MVRGSGGLPGSRWSWQRSVAWRAASSPDPVARQEQRSTPRPVDCGSHGDGTLFPWIAFVMIVESGGQCVAGSDRLPRASFDARRSGGPSLRVREARTRDSPVGARRPGYTGARGYHPLLAVAAGTGDVLMARRPTIAVTPRSRTRSVTSSTASGSTICPRAASPRTRPGSRCR